MQLTGKKRIESATHAGVFLTAKFINSIKRAKRDAKILAERAEYVRTVEEQRALLRGIFGDVVRERFAEGEDGDREYAAERQRLWAAAATDTRQRVDALQEKHEAVFRAVIMPAEIGAALVAVEGLVIDGKKITAVEEFLEAAPDALLDEAWELCRSVSALSEDQEKN
jgi:hypothetical protein